MWKLLLPYSPFFVFKFHEKIFWKKTKNQKNTCTTRSFWLIWPSLKVVYQTFKHQNGSHFFLKLKNVTFWVLKYSSGKNFCCTILSLKNLAKTIENKSAKKKYMNKSAKNYKQKNEQVCKKNYMGILKRMWIALLICSLWKAKHFTQT